MATTYLRITIEADASDEDLVSDLLNDLAGGAGVEVLDRRAAMLAPEAAALPPGRILVRAYIPTDDYDPAALDLSAVPGAVARPPEPLDDDWKEAWKRFFKASRVGRFILRPPWDDLDDRQQGEIDIVIEPGMAFGTGTHETTRLCVDMLDGRVRPGDRVLDVGCGSGILAIAAAKLGAASIVGIDIEEPAVDATLTNAARNGVADRVEASVTPLARITGEYDIVVANILSSVLVALKDDLFARVRPGGTLLLSGILEADADDVAARFRALGLTERAHTRERDWACLRFER